MVRTLTITASLVALAVPVAALANEPGSSAKTNAAQRCSAQQAAMGAKDFGSLYGTNHNGRNAFGKCVSKLAQQEQQDQQNAAQQCRTERNADPAAFAKKYGTNANGKNAFGKCVSAKAKEQSDAQQQATLNAAKACAAERAQDPKAFRDKYGTNHNKRNAFGKCVSTTAQQK
jgi:hypothetical protein